MQTGKIHMVNMLEATNLLEYPSEGGEKDAFRLSDAGTAGHNTGMSNQPHSLKYGVNPLK